MTNISYKILEKRQKMHIKAYAILCGLLLIAVGAYSYFKWLEYTQINVLLTESDGLISTLQSGASQASTNYFEKKPEFDQLDESIEKKLIDIFPETDNYTQLTRQLDSFEEDLAKVNSPFEVSHIDYQSPIETEKYSVLPLRMSIRSSSDNFRKFLHLIENSGSLNDQIRLMDITSIRLNFENKDEDVSTQEIINFTVQINAYFQKKQQ